MNDRAVRLPLFLLLASVLALAACGDAEQAGGADGGQSGEPQEYADAMAEQHAGDSPVPSGAEKLGEVPAMPVLSETVEYAQVNGRAVSGYLAYPESAHGGLPGVLVFHEWWGLNDNVRAMADKLAGQGYVVLALDLYGGVTAAEPEQARQLMRQAMADQAAIDDNTRQAWKFMNEEIGALSVASLGWCLGGSLSLNAALLLPEQLAGAVIYYGHVTSATPEQLATLQMPLLGHFGGADEGIPLDGVRQFEQTLQELGKDAEIFVYDGADHAFANPSGTAFDPAAAAVAWERTLVFLDRTLNAAVNRNVLEQQPVAAEPAPAEPR